MLKNNTPYDPSYDLACQEKSISQNKKQNYDQKRLRYSDWDEDAPISKRQAKKRKEQNTAPNSTDKRT